MISLKNIYLVFIVALFCALASCSNFENGIDPNDPMIGKWQPSYERNVGCSGNEIEFYYEGCWTNSSFSYNNDRTFVFIRYWPMGENCSEPDTIRGRWRRILSNRYEFFYDCEDYNGLVPCSDKIDEIVNFLDDATRETIHTYQNVDCAHGDTRTYQKIFGSIRID